VRGRTNRKNKREGGRQKIQREKKGKHGKENQRINERRRTQQGRAEGKNINRRKHRGAKQHALAIAFVLSFPSPVSSSPAVQHFLP